VLDRDPVDWTEAESRGGETGRLARHLRVVAAVAAEHRAETAPEIETPSVHSRLAPPEAWGHLRIVQRIGRGAFGEVYRARDLRLERDVALKLVPVDEHEGAASSMLREGRLLARIRHPNVVTIYGADQIGGWMGLWMEFVHGRTLDERQRSGHAFGPSEVTRIGVELARALDAVHAAGVIHRDIKAQNVMYEDGGRIVLMDFGAGRGLEEGASDLTGTPLYLAPEIYRGQPATLQTDIYSLGVLLFHLLTRSYPVCGDTFRTLRRAHEDGARVDLSLVRSDVPRRLGRVIDRALNPRPDERYQTSDMLRAALDRAVLSPGRGRVRASGMPESCGDYARPDGNAGHVRSYGTESPT
jgi:serine/threonine-protein kinase